MGTKPAAGFDKNPQNINRKGRPKKEESFTYILWDVLGEPEVSFKGKKITGKEAVARKALELALKGDMAAIKYIMDRIDGTPTQAIRQVDEDGNDIIQTTASQRRKRIAELEEARKAFENRPDGGRGDGAS